MTVRPRNSVAEAYEPFMGEARRLLATDWFLPVCSAIETLVDEETGDSASGELLDRLMVGLVGKLRESFPNFLRSLCGDLPLEEGWPSSTIEFYSFFMGPFGEFMKTVLNRGGEIRLQSSPFGTAAIPFEVTEVNLERVRATVKPGQLWVRVDGPGIGKLEGYLAWRLRAMGKRLQGRTADTKTDMEAARLKDDEHRTYVEIGRHFDWPLQSDPHGNPDRRCRTAEASVKRGRKLRKDNTRI